MVIAVQLTRMETRKLTYPQYDFVWQIVHMLFGERRILTLMSRKRHDVVWASEKNEKVVLSCFLRAKESGVFRDSDYKTLCTKLCAGDSYRPKRAFKRLAVRFYFESAVYHLLIKSTIEFFLLHTHCTNTNLADRWRH